MFIYFSFFFNDTAHTEIYTLSLHDALPIWPQQVELLLHGQRPQVLQAGGEHATAQVGLRCERHLPVRVVEDHRRSEEHTSELQSHVNLVCRLLLEKKKKKKKLKHIHRTQIK